MAPVRVDARGMRCPWPVIRLARAIREGAESVMILADDPIAPGEIAAAAAQQGWSVMPATESGGWIVSKAAIGRGFDQRRTPSGEISPIIVTEAENSLKTGPSR